jgi:hypothetical protein
MPTVAGPNRSPTLMPAASAFAKPTSDALFAAVVVISGLAFTRGRLEPSDARPDEAAGSVAIWSLLTWALGLIVFLLGLRTILRRIVSRSSLSGSVRARYPTYDLLTYLPFLVYALGAWGVRFPLIPSSVVLATVFLLLQAALL